MSNREIPDVIWTYDAQGRRLYGRPNYDKPGVAAQVSRDAFYAECAARPARSSLELLMRLRQINRFEDQQKEAAPCL